ncbi:MAG: hypothetical protein ACRCTI_01755, partial [Beijerinckiaceae bacterium]
MAPGQSLSREEFAAIGRTDERKLVVVLPRLVATGLLALDGDMVVIRPLDQGAMFAALPRRKELEIKIVRAVVANATDGELAAMQVS